LIITTSTRPMGLDASTVMINESAAIVSWMDGGDTASIKYRRVAPSGEMSDEITLTSISAQRGSGFPQMEFYENELYFAWTVYGEDSNTIETVKIKLEPSI
ncbi:MAG: hypothetical protein AAF391_08735, partial [Bacteroidota bacterium]